MELFAINRYDKRSKEDSVFQENEKLGSLVKKITKRKRLMKNKNTEPDPDKVAADVSSENEVESLHPPGKKDGAKELPQDLCGDEDPPLDEFEVLGPNQFRQKRNEMALLSWLRHPTVISNEIASESVDIDNCDYILSPKLVQNLKSYGIHSLFPIQKVIIPWILSAHTRPPPFRPRDLYVSAPTGSGKTISFVLPIVQLLLNHVQRKVRALILLPTAVLAAQICDIIKMLTKDTKLKFVLLSSSVPFEVEQSKIAELFHDKYYSKVDIIVSTPGRLVEHIRSTKGFNLKSLQFLVIDEADRMMEQTINNWLYHLDDHMNAKSDSSIVSATIPLCVHKLESQARTQPHKMLFSATLTQNAENLQNMQMFRPKLITSIVKLKDEMIYGKSENSRGDIIEKYATPAELSEYYVMTQLAVKPLTLFTLIVEYKWKRCLCFTNTTITAKRLSVVLMALCTSNGIGSVAVLSSDLKLGARQQVLRDFSTGKVNILICTDALARGIDVKHVDVVISYDAPSHIKTYIHRIGRTARAGITGTAVTILTSLDLERFNQALAMSGKGPLPELSTNPSLEETYTKEYAVVLQNLQKDILERKNMAKAKKARFRRRKTIRSAKSSKQST